jgi:hypothetical protein
MRAIIGLTFLVGIWLVPNSSAFYGVITSNTTWSGTIDITGDVVVAEAATLIIQPGTNIRFSITSAWDTTLGQSGKSDLIVYGRLKAKGTASDTIKFIPVDTTGLWGSIFFKEGSIGDTLSYTKITGCTNTACDFEYSESAIDHTTIAGVHGDLVGDLGGNATGILAYRSSLILNTVSITNCIGRDAFEFYASGGSGIAISCSGCPLVEATNVRIDNCVGGIGSGPDDLCPVCGGYGEGIQSQNTLLRVSNASISNCKGGWGTSIGGRGLGVSLRDTLYSSFVHHSSIFNCTDKTISNLSETRFDAQNNYWGTVNEFEITKGLQGPVEYSPWTDSTYTMIHYSTMIYGEIEKDTVWRDTVKISGDVHIPEGITLTIEPKTTILVSNNSLWDYSKGVSGVCDVVVNGKIKAIGTPQEKINFSPYDAAGNWGGIRLVGNNGDTIKFLKITKALTGVYCDSSSPLIANCELSEIKGTGIYCRKANPEIRNNFLFECRGYDSGNRGGDGIGIFCDNASPFIIGNRIEGCYGGWTFASSIEHSEPANGIGIVCYGNSAPVISSNRIINFVGGTWFVHGEFWGCGDGIGIGCFGSSSPLIGGAPSAQNDIYLTDSIYNIYRGYPLFWVKNQTPNNITATYNWWGTTNRDSIASLIFDRNDNSRYGYVLFEPWANGPLGDTTHLPPPPVFALDQGYPNPFRSFLHISYTVGIESPITLVLYDAVGRRIRLLVDENQKPSKYEIKWDGDDDHGMKVGDGVYFCRLESDTSSAVVKIVRLK